MAEEQQVDVRTIPTEELTGMITGEAEVEAQPEETPTIAPETEEGKQTEEQASEVPPVPETVSKEEHEKVLKRLDDQEKFIQRQGTEIGLLRKQNPSDINAKIQQLRDEWYNLDPIEAQSRWDALKKEQDEAEKANQQYRFEATINENREIVKSAVPEYETSIDDIVGLIVEDGVSPAEAEMLKKNPYVLDPTLAVNLYKRSRLTKEVSTLKAEVDRLSKENETLRKRPDEMVKKIEEATKQPHLLTGKTGGANGAPDTNGATKPIHRMTTEELTAFLKSTGG